MEYIKMKFAISDRLSIIGACVSMLKLRSLHYSKGLKRPDIEMNRSMKYILGVVALLFCFQPLLSQEGKSRVKIPKETKDTGFKNPLSMMEVPSLLSASPDSFALGSSRIMKSFSFQARQYSVANIPLLFNGVEVNDACSGEQPWYLWAGMNDATGNERTGWGLSSTHDTMGALGGSRSLTVKASALRKSKRLSYSFSNDLHTHRIMGHYSSGKLSNGCYLSFTGSVRGGEEGYVRGTHSLGESFLLALSKDINSRHTLSLTGFAAPVEQGIASISSEMAYQAAGNHYFNRGVGTDGGKLRNAHILRRMEPVVTLSHDWKISPTSALSSTLWYRDGGSTVSELKWRTDNPYPDFFGLFPPFSANPPDKHRMFVNFDEMRHRNMNPVGETPKDEAGNPVASGNRAEYIVAGRSRTQRELALSSVINTSLSNTLRLDGGVSVSGNRSRYYNRILDLLGGDYWYDVDSHLSGREAFSDLDNPYRIARKGDKFGYFYATQRVRTALWGQLRHSSRRWESFVAVEIGSNHLFREGFMKNGVHASESKGKSAKLDYLTYKVKGGTQYKINGRHYLAANFYTSRKAPHSDIAFALPENSNRLTPGLEAEKSLSGEFSYLLRNAFVKARVTGYFTCIWDKGNRISFYNASRNTINHYLLSGVSEQYIGVEAGIELKLSPTVRAVLVGAVSDNSYAGTATLSHFSDNVFGVIDSDIVEWQGRKIAGGPTEMASVTLSYNSPKQWYVELSANYAGRAYTQINPTFYTERLRTTPGFKSDYALQEDLGRHITLDARVGSSWTVAKKHTLSVNLSASNLLNNTNIRLRGWEQMPNRMDTSGGGNASLTKPVEQRYLYMYGLTYFINASWRW
ncbi:MAG: TonB-dependent receptor [Porphyromonas sp.]|nr:TonB-dependent receptor [Porphyromonas sp.]